MVGPKIVNRLERFRIVYLRRRKFKKQKSQSRRSTTWFFSCRSGWVCLAEMMIPNTMSFDMSSDPSTSNTMSHPLSPDSSDNNQPETRSSAVLGRETACASTAPQAPVIPPTITCAAIPTGPLITTLASAATPPATAILDPTLVVDLLGEDPAKRHLADAARQDAVVSAWVNHPRAMTTEVDCRRDRPLDPEPYAMVADATAAGVDSPLAARAIMGQVLNLTAALRKTPQRPEERQAQIRQIRAQMQELRPQGAIDSMLAGHLLMYDQARFKIMFYLTASTDAIEVTQYATALEKLTQAQLDTMAFWDRRRRPSTRAGHHIVVRDQAQAVIGDLGPGDR
jgi:hypothetical protein